MASASFPMNTGNSIIIKLQWTFQMRPTSRKQPPFFLLFSQSNQIIILETTHKRLLLPGDHLSWHYEGLDCIVELYGENWVWINSTIVPLSLTEFAKTKTGKYDALLTRIELI